MANWSPVTGRSHVMLLDTQVRKVTFIMSLVQSNRGSLACKSLQNQVSTILYLHIKKEAKALDYLD